MPRSNSNAFAVLTAVVCACITYSGLLLGYRQAGSTGFLSAPRAAHRISGPATSLASQAGRTQLAALTADVLAPPQEENETIEIKGFSALLVGLALLPYVACCLKTVFDLTFGGKAFDFGPYGVVAIACLTTVCVTLWSLGSYVQRGRGLPAGPLGFLGLAEGFSYIGSIGLAIALLTNFAKVSTVQPVKAPEVKTSAVKTTAVKTPEIKVPDFKAPEVKVSEIKAPKVDSKAPELKAPEIKVPEVKLPEVKAPEMPKPKAPEVAPKLRAPEAKPAPAPEVKKAPPLAKTSTDDYSDLFN